MHEDAIRKMPELAEKRKARTEFFAVLDRVAREVGVDLEQIRKEQEEMDRLFDEGKEDESQALFAKIREQILPVYKRMRELGYTHEDLVT